MRKTLLSVAALLALHTGAHAAISVNTVGFTYSQNFDSLTTSTTASTWANDSTLAGWSLYTGAFTDITSIVAGNGGSNAGSFYSFGTTASSDRAFGGTASGGTYFGSPASGAVAGYIAAAFTNTSGSTLDGFTLGFNGEQWRNGGNTSAQTMVLEYGFGTAIGTVATWTAAPTLSWASPVVGATAAAVDGNAAGLVGNLSASFSGLAWGNNSTLWLRWTERNDAGNDHGLAIDDLSFSVSAIPEPGTLAMLLAGLGAVGFIARRRA